MKGCLGKGGGKCVRVCVYVCVCVCVTCCNTNAGGGPGCEGEGGRCGSAARGVVLSAATTRNSGH